jgi:hypothetical protein
MSFAMLHCRNMNGLSDEQVDHLYLLVGDPCPRKH